MEQVWMQGVLATDGRANTLLVAGVKLRDGMTLRLRGVLGRVGQMRGELVFVLERHAMHGNPLMEHLGETATIPV